MKRAYHHLVERVESLLDIARSSSIHCASSTSPNRSNSAGISHSREPLIFSAMAVGPPRSVIAPRWSSSSSMALVTLVTLRRWRRGTIGRKAATFWSV